MKKLSSQLTLLLFFSVFAVFLTSSTIIDDALVDIPVTTETEVEEEVATTATVKFVDGTIEVYTFTEKQVQDEEYMENVLCFNEKAVDSCTYTDGTCSCTKPTCAEARTCYFNNCGCPCT